MVKANTPKRIRANPAVRRLQIIDEAIRIVGEFGFYGFTVQQLAARCGLSNAGLLHYFGGKDDLLLALLDEIERREEEIMAPQVVLVLEELARSGDRRKAMFDLIRAISMRNEQDRERTRFLSILQGEAMEVSHPAHIWFGQREDETIELFERVLGNGEGAKRQALQLIAIFRGLVGLWLRSTDRFDLVEECVAAARPILQD